MAGTKERDPQPHLLIGTSGWQYSHWRGVFYPDDLPQRLWLEHYAGQFAAVEVNATFYRLPAEGTFDSWRRRTPEGFRYVLKYSRYGTHIKHLGDPAEHVEAFCERARRLGDRLAGVLVQLPPQWPCDLDRLAGFLAACPAEMRWAFEFRHPSWLRPEVYDILRGRNAALCIHDYIAAHPVEITADWTYFRYHGPGANHGGCYNSPQLAAEAGRIAALLADGLDVCAFFNNDARGHAVANATALQGLLRQDARLHPPGSTGAVRASS